MEKLEIEINHTNNTLSINGKTVKLSEGVSEALGVGVRQTENQTIFRIDYCGETVLGIKSPEEQDKPITFRPCLTGLEPIEAIPHLDYDIKQISDLFKRLGYEDRVETSFPVSIGDISHGWVIRGPVRITLTH